MDALVHRLETDIREHARDFGRDPQIRADMLRRLDEIRLSITRPDALRLEMLIERLLGSSNVR